MSEQLLDPALLGELRQIEIAAMTGTCEIWRPPAKTSGKYGPPTRLTPQPIRCEVIPIGRAVQLGLAPPGLAGGQVDLVVLLPFGTNVDEGDEVRTGDVIRTVTGVSRHSTVVAVLVREVRA